MLELSSESWTAIAAIAGIFALIATLVMLWLSIFTRARDKSETLFIQKLSDTRDHSEIIDRYGRRPMHLSYARAIDNLNVRIADFFGPAYSWRAFDRCLQIALFYPVALFLVAWLFGASGTIGAVIILPNIENQFARLWPILLMIFSISIIATLLYSARTGGFIYHNISILLNISGKSIPWTRNISVNSASIAFSSIISFAVIMISIYVYGYFIGYAFGYYFSYNLSTPVENQNTGDLAVIFPVILIICLVFLASTNRSSAGFSFVFIVISIFFSFAIAILNINSSTSAFTIFIFYAILPLVNAFIDMMSWMFTRTFMARLARPKSGIDGALRVFFEILLDLFLAAACLVALVVFCALLIEGIDRLSSALGWSANTDWRQLAERAAIQPANPNSWLVIGMLGTTVVPTALHIGTGIGAVVPALRPRTDVAVKRIAVGMTQATRTEIARVLARADGLSWLASAGIAALTFFVLLAAMLYLASLNGHWLVKIALWATCWSHGQCPTW